MSSVKRFAFCVITDLDLDWWPWTSYQQKGLVTKYTHAKYEGPNSYQSKDMANVNVFADKQTDWPKTTWPRSIDAAP